MRVLQADELLLTGRLRARLAERRAAVAGIGVLEGPSQLARLVEGPEERAGLGMRGSTVERNEEGSPETVLLGIDPAVRLALEGLGCDRLGLDQPGFDWQARRLHRLGLDRLEGSLGSRVGLGASG